MIYSVKTQLLLNIAKKRQKLPKSKKKSGKKYSFFMPLRKKFRFLFRSFSTLYYFWLIFFEIFFW